MLLSELQLIADDHEVQFPKYSFPPETVQKIKKRFNHVTESMLDKLAQELDIWRYTLNRLVAMEADEETPALNDGKTGAEIRAILKSVQELAGLLKKCNRRTVGLIDEAYAFNKKAPKGITLRGRPAFGDVVHVLDCFSASITDDEGNIRALLVTGKGRRKGGDILPATILENISSILCPDDDFLGQADTLYLVKLLKLQISEGHVKQWRKERMDLK